MVDGRIMVGRKIVIIFSHNNLNMYFGTTQQGCLNPPQHMLWLWNEKTSFNYSKNFVKRSLLKDRKLIFKTNYRLMQVKGIAECSKGIAECSKGSNRPSLSYRLSFRSLFCLFLSSRLRQVLLYTLLTKGQSYCSVLFATVIIFFK